MKFSPVISILLNLFCRILILIYLLGDNAPEPKGKTPVPLYMDPMAKRVFLIVVNGLNRDFLNVNATPYINQMVANYGFSGVLSTLSMETTDGGLKGILTGRTGHSTPLIWSRPSHTETILKYLRCYCAMGHIDSDLPLNCYYPEEDPLRSFLKFPTLFDPKVFNSCFYLINFDFDPVLIEEYKAKLSKMDDDVRVMANTIDGVWNDNKTTYIITSSRGSPVGDSLTIESPIAAWGRGIAHRTVPWLLRRNDLAAMLCPLLGITYPTGLIGIIPLGIMDLPDHYRFVWIRHTLKHFETVLELYNPKDHRKVNSELREEQLLTKLSIITQKLRMKMSVRWFVVFGWVAITHMAWDVYLMAVSATGYCQIVVESKVVLMLIVGTGSILTYFPNDWYIKVMFVLTLWLMYNNVSHIQQEIKKILKKCLVTFCLALAGIVLVIAAGNQNAIFFLFTPVVFWPICNGSLLRLNVLMLISRLLSGIALPTLFFNRVYGEMPHTFVMFVTSIVFIIQFTVFFHQFNKPVDLRMKAVYLLILLTGVHISALYKKNVFVMQDVVSVLIVVLFFFSLSFVSGSLLERFMKILLSLYVPVQMFSIRTECIFYFAFAIHLFTWIFIEYHSGDSSVLKFSPPIFSVEAVSPSEKAAFSVRKIVFFLMYVYISYHALGHDPDLHAYDFYIVPKYFYRYPVFVSYFLVGVKFFIPFLIPTLAFITSMALEKKDGEFQLTTFLWISDMMSIIIISFGCINRVIIMDLLPGSFTHVILQQCGNICIIVAYLLGTRVFLSTDSWVFRLPEKESGKGRGGKRVTRP